MPGVTLRVTQSDLLRHLDGEVYALWRDFEALPDVIGLGASGDAVSWLQSALAELGFYTAEIQGRFDEATRDAVSRFQKHRGLQADGAVNARTLMASTRRFPATPLRTSNPIRSISPTPPERSERRARPHDEDQRDGDGLREAMAQRRCPG